MKKYKAVIICSDCTKTFSFEKEFIFEIIEHIAQHGKYLLQTERNTYEVKGVLFGDMSEQIIYT